MFVIGEAVLEDDVAAAAFCCDLPVCKGACCTLEGGRGAPLLPGERADIAAAWPAVRSILRPEAVAVIARTGLTEGPPDDATTPCIGERDCVYVVFEGDVAQCAFEKAYLEGRTTWRKPLSCHLFPIRVRRTASGPHLRYERIRECAPGRQRGAADGVPLHAFLREPLARAFGERFVADLQSACDSPLTSRTSDPPPC
jgi:hypothetical protein